MAFNTQKFYKMDAGWSELQVANWYKYETTDSRATVNASGYFPDTLGLMSNDVIYAVSDDGPQLIYVLTDSPVTVGDLVDATVDLPPGSVTTAALAAEAVTSPKLDLDELKTAGVIPIYKAIVDSDNNITQNVAVTGVAAGDIVVASIKATGASPVEVEAIEAAANEIVITWSALPSTDHKLNVLCFKA